MSRVLPTFFLALMALAVTPGTRGVEELPALAGDPGPGLGPRETVLEADTTFGPENPVYPDLQGLRQELESILTSTGNRRGRWGVMAISLDRGDTLLALNPDQPMVPASNMKVLSTAAALHHLGPDYRYRTFILGQGETTDGVLNGDLVFYGTGDPAFSERYLRSGTAGLDSLVLQMRDAGIRRVLGNLVVDGSYFQGPDRHPDWKPSDLNDAFAAPISAVSLEENVVTVRVEAGGWVGAQPSIFTIPEAAGIPIANVARTMAPGTRSRVWLFRETPQDPIGIEGEIPLGGRDVWRRLPVPDPLRFTGIQLKRSLEAAGIEVAGEVVTIRDAHESPLSRGNTFKGKAGGPPLEILALHESPPLLDLLRVINKESNNFLAETVAKTLGRARLGDGSFSGGARAIEAFLTQEVGVSPEGLRVRDGSGLSDQNQASAEVFVRTLEFMVNSSHREEFLETLPEAGLSRELGRMYRSPAARNLRAKTGTMEGVSALSGLVRTRSGERILFSILSNEIASEYRAKRAEDQLGIRLASLTRPLPD